MNYEFALNKTALVSLIIGSLVIGILFFSAGMVVGSQWLTDSHASGDAVAKNEEPDLPKEPVINEDQAAPAKTTPPKKVTPAKEPAPAPQVTAPTAAAAQAQAVNGGIEIVQEAAADASAEAAESEPEYVTVQVGVFLDQSEANRLLKQIENKGYSPSFFSGRDAEARQWYAVRIGAYSDRQQASIAAANFTRQEKLKAVVRPLGSL
jgi:cell division protein FtsN